MVLKKIFCAKFQKTVPLPPPSSPSLPRTLVYYARRDLKTSASFYSLPKHWFLYERETQRPWWNCSLFFLFFISWEREKRSGGKRSLTSLPGKRRETDVLEAAAASGKSADPEDNGTTNATERCFALAHEFFR